MEKKVTCYLYTGDTPEPFISTWTKSTVCHFYIKSDDLERRFQSVGSRNVSCDYSVETDTERRSPRSDSYSVPGVLQSPEISVNPSSVSEGQSLRVTCEAPSYQRSFQWFLYRNTEDSPFMKGTDSGSMCDFTVTWTKLLQGKTPTGIYTAVELSCEYRDGATSSQRSKRMEVKVVGSLQPPQLNVSSTNTTKTDSVQLSCETPQSVSVSRCQFLSDGQIVGETSSPCRRSITGTQLLRGTIHSGDAQIVVQCLYTADINGINIPSPSPRSNSITVTVTGFPMNSTSDPVSTTNLTAVIDVSSTLLPENSFVGVTCAAPRTVREATWRLYRDAHTSPVLTRTGKGNLFRFSVTGRNLLQGETHTDVYTVVQLSCEYTDSDSNTISQRSSRRQLILLGKLPPAKLTLSPAMVTERGSVQLSCEGPQNLPVSQCQFHADKKRLTETPSDCQLSIAGAELLRRGGHSMISGVIKVDCQYIVGAGLNAPSPRSDGLSVTLLVEPNINVSTHHNETVVRCEAPPPVTGALFYLHEKERTQPITEIRAAEGERAVIFSVPRSPDTTVTYCCAYKYQNFSSPLSNCTGSQSAQENKNSGGWMTHSVIIRITITVAVLLLGVPIVYTFWRRTKQASNRRTITLPMDTEYDDVEERDNGPVSLVYSNTSPGGAPEDTES